MFKISRAPTSTLRGTPLYMKTLLRVILISEYTKEYFDADGLLGFKIMRTCLKNADFGLGSHFGTRDPNFCVKNL